MSTWISFSWILHWAWWLFFLLEYKGMFGFASSPPDQRSFFRWIQVVSSSAGYRVCNVRGLRMWHSDTERPVGTNRNVITSRGSIALCYSSHRYLPFPPCLLSAGCPVVSALVSCARRLGSNPKPTWRGLNPFQTLSGKTLRNFSWVDFSYRYLISTK